jgi:hypothetical protein
LWECVNSKVSYRKGSWSVYTSDFFHYGNQRNRQRAPYIFRISFQLWNNVHYKSKHLRGFTHAAVTPANAITQKRVLRLSSR